MSTGNRANVDVMILAFNEEMNLPHALESVTKWTHRVFVVDSGSTDGTHEIVRSFGAELVDRPWLGYSRQKNWALDNLPFESDWILILDADEAITSELQAEIQSVVGRPTDSVAESGFYLNRLFYFLGKPIRHCGYFPSWNLRLFKRGKARYEDRSVHEHMIVDGPTGRLSKLMLHEDRRGLEHYIAKHNRYSTLEAREIFRGPRENSARYDQLERSLRLRRWLKYKVLPRLPLAGVWRFMYMYFLRLGFLDGITGLRFCQLLATYDTFISLKLTELRVRPGAESSTVSGLAISEGEIVDEHGSSKVQQ